MNRINPNDPNLLAQTGKAKSKHCDKKQAETPSKNPDGSALTPEQQTAYAQAAALREQQITNEKRFALTDRGNLKAERSKQDLAAFFDSIGKASLAERVKNTPTDSVASIADVSVDIMGKCNGIPRNAASAVHNNGIMTRIRNHPHAKQIAEAVLGDGLVYADTVQQAGQAEFEGTVFAGVFGSPESAQA